MFLLNEILVVAPGRRQEALDRLGWIHGLMAPKPGFRQAIVAKYLGDGSRHTVLRVWESEETFRSFREGPDGNYGKGRPPGLYTNETVVPQWTSMLESQAPDRGSYLVKTQYELPAEDWDSFTDHQRQLQAAMASLGTPVSAWVLRARDRDESLSVARFPDRAAFEQLLDSAAYLKVLETLPAGVKTLTTQCFEIVRETGPA
jgi:heme-degrading monooxygenase HmoA